MTWFISSILAGLSFALARAISRVYLKKQGDALAFTSIHDFVAGFVLLPIIFFGFHWPTLGITWIFFLGIVLFAFLSDWLAFLALKTTDVSIYQIVNQVRHIFVLIGGLLLFAEAINTYKLVAVILIIFGVLITLYQKTKFYWNKGIILTTLSTLAAVVAFIFVKFTVRDFSEIALASIELMAIGFLSFGLMRFNTANLLSEFRINKKGLILSGFFFGLFEFLLFYALKIGDISKVVPTIQSSLIFGVLIGIIFLGERERIWQKIIGMVIIVIGIIILN